MSESNTRAEIIETMARAMTRFALRDALDEAEAALTALETAGMAVVPREPTARMIIAGASAKPFANRMNTLTAAGVWSAMLAAAKPAQEDPDPPYTMKRSAS